MRDLAGEQPTVELSVRRPGGERRRRGRATVPALTVLYHPHLPRVGGRVLLPELTAGGVCRLSRSVPRFDHPDGRPGGPLDDPYVSRSPLLLAGLRGGGLRLVAGGTPTPLRVDGEEVAETLELSAGRVARGAVLELASRVVLLLHDCSPEPRAEPDGCGLVGDSDAMLRVRQDVHRVADLDLPVLLRGETGTGKELVARALHRLSRRRQGPFVSVNLAAVPASLAASELFGAVKGAFTGSLRAQPGFFQRADGGTLFLDEVGEAPAEVQAALLRVLESGEIQRVGSQAPLRVDVRLLAATDLDLETAIEAGDFRAPLLHRLAGYEILLPPLRGRRDDFGRLLVHFLSRELEETGEAHRLTPVGPADPPWLPASIVARLARHDWPGNVRQLENVVRQLVVAGRGAGRVRVTPRVERLLREAEEGGADETVVARGGGAAAAPAAPVGDSGRPRHGAAYRSPAEVDEDELVAALRAHRWQIKPAAAALGVSRPSLYNLIERSARVRKVADLDSGEITACRRRFGGDLDAMADHLEVSRAGLQQRLAARSVAGG
jgi:two-component system, NtrC family, nitrogen regulation response regulator GlnG